MLAAAFCCAEGKLQFADLGDFPLENGQIIRTCRIGYRTYGTLNAEKSNAILLTTWLSGTTAELASLIGFDNLLDGQRYFVIAVDALGNGVSSSPSNSALQPGKEFPEFSIVDMVKTEYRLLTEFLELPSLFAVMGISMGGMQTLQWVVAYPEFNQKAISIVGTPRLTPYERVLWNSQLAVIEALNAHLSKTMPAMDIIADQHLLHLYTPTWVNQQVQTTDLQSFHAAQTAVTSNFDPQDWARQLKAILHLDIYRSQDGNLEKTAATIKTELLLINSEKDLMVNAAPAVELAKAIPAQLVLLRGDCGHVVFACQADTIFKSIQQLLEN
jgi:homoserine O-acetyltransferase